MSLTPADLDALAGRLAEAVVQRLRAVGDGRWLTIPEAAEYARVSPETIRRHLATRALVGHYPCPGRVLIDRQRLDALIAGRTRRPRRGRGKYKRNGNDTTQAGRPGSSA